MQTTIHRDAAGPGSIASAHAGAVLSAAEAASASQPLDAGVRSHMEGSFGVSFADVRVHSDAAAAQAAQELNANAFTAGRDIYFDKGKYQPGSEGGQRLLAHELAHVAQGAHAAASGSGAGPTVSSPSDPAEVQADRAADAVMRGQAVTGLGAAPASAVHRDALGDLDSTSRGNWLGDVDEDEALRRAAALSDADKRSLATDARWHPTLRRLCAAFNASEMMRLFQVVPYFALQWRIYWLIVANVIEGLSADQWRRVIGTASPEDMDTLRRYPTGYRAFVRNGPDNLVAPWDRLQGLKEGWWRGDPATVRYAVNTLSPAQKETVRGDAELMRVIVRAAGTAEETFRTVNYLGCPLKWSVYWLNEAGHLSRLGQQHWSQLLAEAPKAELDELVGWDAMWQLTQTHCPAPVLQLVRQNTQDPNTVTGQLADPVSLRLLIGSLGPVGVLALATQPGTDVAANYGHIASENQVHPILDGLPRGMRLGERTQANLRQWFMPPAGETDIPTLEKMCAVRFNVDVGGTGGAGGPHGSANLQPWTAASLRRAWQVLETLPPAHTESSPAFLHLLRDQSSTGGYYAGTDTSSGWDNSVVIGLPTDAHLGTMHGAPIYGGAMPHFNETVRHELGHAVDNQLTITASIQNEDWAGNWINHGNPTAWVDALIAAGGGLHGHGYPAAEVSDYRAAMIQAASQGITFVQALTQVRAAAGKGPPTAPPDAGPIQPLMQRNRWHHGSRYWSANAWTPQGGRNFVRAYGDAFHWWSFKHATMAAHRATNYQWRAPKEWFAECYAVYYAELETGGAGAPVGGRLRSVDSAAASFIANQVDRSHSPNVIPGAGGAADRTVAAPGTRGGVGGGSP